MTDTVALDNEAAVRYDRQVRLWGTTTQRLLQSAKLIVGPGAVVSEAVKNLVLGGVGHVVLHDASPTSTADVDTCFLLRESDMENGMRLDEAVSARLKSLNPLVNVAVARTTDELIAAATAGKADGGSADEGFPTLTFALLGSVAGNLADRLHASAAAAGTHLCVFQLFAHTSSESLIVVSTSAREAMVVSGGDPASAVLISRRADRAQLCFLRFVAATRLSEKAPFAERLETLLDVRDELSAHLVSDGLIEDEALPECAAGTTPGVVHNSVLGGIVCQQVIGRVTAAATAADAKAGRKAAVTAPTGTLFGWAHVHGGECVVGTLDE